jgi:hypothetical protein
MFFEPGAGIAPAVDRGRAPTGPSEIALGKAELSTLHVSIGDTVKVQRGGDDTGGPPTGPTVPAVVTGRVVLAAPVYQTLTLGQGGAITSSMLERLGSTTEQAPSFFVKLHRPEQLRAAYEDLTARLQPSFAFPRADNAAVGSLRKITHLVSLLLGVLLALTAGALLHRIVATARRRQHDMATMRSLGFTPSQVARSHLVHGALVALVAGVIAVPVGLLAARAGWQQVAGYLGVVPRAVVRPVTITGILLLSVVAGALLGLLLGLRARRTPPARVLRTE